MVKLRQRIGDVIAGRESKIDNQSVPPNLQPFSMATPPPRGGRDLLRSYGKSPWLHMVVGKVSLSVSRLPWTLSVARRANDGQRRAFRHSQLQTAGAEWRRNLRRDIGRRNKQVELEEIDEHPLLDLLSAGNEHHGSGWSVFELAQIHMDLIGEVFLFKERHSTLGIPIQLWPIDPIMINRIPTRERPFFEVRLERGRMENIPAEDIIHIAKPNPADPYKRGVGIGMAISDEIQVDEYAVEHIKSAFYNNLKTDTIISGEGLSQEDTRRLEADWRNRFRKVWNRFMPYFINRQVQVHSLNQKLRDAGATDMRKFAGELCRIVYGAPPEIFGIIESSNRATIQAADHLFSKYVVDPRKDYLRLGLQQQLVPDFDERLVLDYPSPVQADHDFVLKAAEAAPWALMVDEWRELQDLEPLEDGKGERFMRPFNLLPSSDFDESPTEAEEPGAEEPEGAEAAAPSAVTETRAEAYPVKQLSEAQIEQIIASIKVSDLIENASPAQREALQAFAENHIDEIGVGIDFDMESPEVQEFLNTENTSVNKLKAVSQTTKNRVRKALIEGAQNQETGQKLAKRIEGVFKQSRGPRSRMIARTEMGRAQNFAHHEAHKQAGIEKQDWLTSTDERVRGSHRSMHRQKRKTDEWFVSGAGNQAQYPGGFGLSSEDINCRCVITAVLDGKSIAGDEKTADLYWKAQDQFRQEQERMFRRAVIRGLNKQETAALDTLRNMGE